MAEALAKLGLSMPTPVLRAFTNAVLEASVYTAKVQPEEPGMAKALVELRSL